MVSAYERKRIEKQNAFMKALNDRLSGNDYSDLEEEEERKRKIISAKASSRRSFIQNAADGGGMINPRMISGR